MSAFERTLKQYLVSYRMVDGDFLARSVDVDRIFQVGQVSE